MPYKGILTAAYKAQGGQVEETENNGILNNAGKIQVWSDNPAQPAVWIDPKDRDHYESVGYYARNRQEFRGTDGDLGIGTDTVNWVKSITLHDVASMLPLIGDAIAIQEIYQELQKNPIKWGLIGILGGATIIGVIPGVGKAIGGAMKAGARSVINFSKKLRRATPEEMALVQKTGMPVRVKVCHLAKGGSTNDCVPATVNDDGWVYENKVDQTKAETYQAGQQTISVDEANATKAEFLDFQEKYNPNMSKERLAEQVKLSDGRIDSLTVPDGTPTSGPINKQLHDDIGNIRDNSTTPTIRTLNRDNYTSARSNVLHRLESGTVDKITPAQGKAFANAYIGTGGGIYNNTMDRQIFNHLLKLTRAEQKEFGRKMMTPFDRKSFARIGDEVTIYRRGAADSTKDTGVSWTTNPKLFSTYASGELAEDAAKGFTKVTVSKDKIMAYITSRPGGVNFDGEFEVILFPNTVLPKGTKQFVEPPSKSLPISKTNPPEGYRPNLDNGPVWFNDEGEAWDSLTGEFLNKGGIVRGTNNTRKGILRI